MNYYNDKENDKILFLGSNTSFISSILLKGIIKSIKKNPTKKIIVIVDTAPKKDYSIFHKYKVLH